MTQCKSNGCNATIFSSDINRDYCLSCLVRPTASDPVLGKEPAKQSSGGNNGYWLLDITHPKRLDPYTAECEDIIEALGMTFQEGEAFKAIWRKCADRLGNGKPGDTPLRNAEKVAHFGKRMVAIEQRKLECTISPN